MSEERVERRLAAILAADVTGYSRLMGQDEAGLLARLRAHRRELIDPKIAEHKGRFRREASAATQTTSHGRLMLTVLGGLTEFERDLICGVKLGRKPKLTRHQQQEARRRRESGLETLADIARSYNVSHMGR